MADIKLNIVNAYELDPTKKYMIELSAKSYSHEDAHTLAKTLRNAGVPVVVGIRNSDEETKIIELPEEI